jgi:hypothetical protein
VLGKGTGGKRERASRVDDLKGRGMDGAGKGGKEKEELKSGERESE